MIEPPGVINVKTPLNAGGRVFPFKIYTNIQMETESNESKNHNKTHPITQLTLMTGFVFQGHIFVSLPDMHNSYNNKCIKSRHLDFFLLLKQQNKSPT